MSVAPELVHLVRQWVEKAKNDLRNAEHTLTIGEECPFDTVCFHAQQCAEKYIRALLCFQQVDFPKTHDIADLVTFLPHTVQIPLTISECDRLTDYATGARYPGDWGAIDRNEAEVAVEWARRVRGSILQHLGPVLNSPENLTT